MVPFLNNSEGSHSKGGHIFYQVVRHYSSVGCIISICFFVVVVVVDEDYKDSDDDSKVMKPQKKKQS